MTILEQLADYARERTEQGKTETIAGRTEETGTLIAR